MERLDLQRVRQGDLIYLRKLDARGLTPAVGEDAPAFAERLEALQKNLAEFEARFQADGKADLEGLRLQKKDRIPKSCLEIPLRQTDELYGFQCDWVPGYFCNPRFSWLFGGCTYSYPPDLFTVFIIGERLRKHKKYLCYNRDEILAHELCHVARAGLASTEFEEFLAYQTARSPFRRTWGGIVHSQMDTLLFLVACLALLAGQILLPLFAPGMPSWLGWAFFGAVMAFLILRHLRTIHVYKTALKKLLAIPQGTPETARRILFHATDTEIHRMAKASDIPALLREFSGELRWKVVLNANDIPSKQE